MGIESDCCGLDLNPENPQRGQEMAGRYNLTSHRAADRMLDEALKHSFTERYSTFILGFQENHPRVYDLISRTLLVFS